MIAGESFRMRVTLLSLLVVVTSGLASLLLGKDMNWDLLNYHYYNPHALISGRLDRDIVPAQLQTFLNPLADVPFYLMTRSLSSWAVGIILGSVHGLNLVLVFILYASFFPPDGSRRWWLKGGALLLTTALAPGFIYELGGTMNDSLVSLFVLFPLLLLLKSDSPPGWRVVAAAGFAFGLGVGLKPVIAPYAVCATVLLPLLFPALRERLTMPFLFAAAGGGGGIVTAGFWWWEMGSRYGNPFIPFFNHIFQSPYIVPRHFVFMKFVPSFPETLVWPLIFALRPDRVQMGGMVDIRFPILYMLFLAFAAVMVWKRVRRERLPLPRRETFLFSFVVASFVCWMLWSSLYRFLIPLELLAPLTIMLLTGLLVDGRRRELALVVCMALILLPFRPPHLARAAWKDPWFPLSSPIPRIPDGATVVMMGSGSSALSYLVPSFAPSVSFLRSESNLALREHDLLFVTIRERVDAALEKGFPLYLLFDPKDRRLDPAKGAARLGLSFDMRECTEIVPEIAPRLLLCPAKRGGT